MVDELVFSITAETTDIHEPVEALDQHILVTEKKLDQAEDHIKRVEEHRKNVEDKTKFTVIGSLSLISGVIGVFKAVITLFGETLDPIFSIIYDIIGVVVSTMLSAAAALSASVYLAGVGVTLAVISGAFQIAAIFSAQQAQSEAARQFSNIQSVFGATRSLL